MNIVIDKLRFDLVGRGVMGVGVAYKYYTSFIFEILLLIIQPMPTYAYFK